MMPFELSVQTVFLEQRVTDCICQLAGGRLVVCT